MWGYFKIYFASGLAEGIFTKLNENKQFTKICFFFQRASVAVLWGKWYYAAQNKQNIHFYTIRS